MVDSVKAMETEARFEGVVGLIVANTKSCPLDLHLI
jgi:hypothetical protein